MVTVVRIHDGFGIEMVEEIEKCNPEMELLYWSDNYTGLLNEKFSRGGKCIPFWKVKALFEKKELERVLLTPFYIAGNVIDEVQALGIPKEKIYVYEGKKNNDSIFTELDKFVMLPYLEFHVADHCNLNCKGCATFSPLCEKDVFAEIGQFRRDIARVKELIPFIRTIQIMGGEPLLNPHLSEFIKATREVYPYSGLRLVTNGTLLDRLEEEKWQTIIDNKVTINISCYPAVYGKMEKIIKEIKAHNGVMEPMISQVSLFYPNLTKYKKYPYENTDFCRCYNLRDGKVSSCPNTMYGHYYNDFFKEKIPFDSGIIDIYQEDLDGAGLIKKLNEPCEACNYCQNYAWRLNSKFVEGKAWNFYKKGEIPEKSDWE